MSKSPKAPQGAIKNVAKPKPKAARGARKSEQSDERWRAFAREYVIDFNGTQAAIRAGYAVKGAAVQASRLLTNAKVQEFVRRANSRNVERAERDGAAVVRRLHDMLMADPRELVSVYVSCCRHCYGLAHGYQFTLGEYNAAREKWLDEGKAIEKFDEKGGVGYDARRAPFPECPECFGEGVPRQVLKDTRHMSPRTVALYAGTRVGKNGAISIDMHSQLDVAEKLMRHHGQYLADNKQKGGAGQVPGVFEVVFVEPPPREQDPLTQPAPAAGGRTKGKA